MKQLVELSMNNSNEHFFLFFRWAIGTSQRFPEGLSEEDWRSIYKIAQQQSLLGVLFDAIQQNPAIRLERKLLLKWYAACERIQQGNRKTNQAAVELTRFLKEMGLRGCILKGQGNTLNYPNPYSRMSGDIDVWVKPIAKSGEKNRGGRGMKGEFVKRVIGYVRRRNPGAKACYHHIDAGMFQGVEVEIHYRPSFMNNLVHNRRLQRWFEENAEEQFSHEVELPDGAGCICVPTNAFNRIYQMAHISNHIIHEGIGLRQLVDYYCVLKQGFTEDEKRRDAVLLRRFGLYDMACAVMYVLQEVLHLEERLLLVPVDERRGRFLLNEIMLAGNFGQYDERVDHHVSQMGRNIQRLKRNLRLMWYFPSECLWEPVFRIYHFFWRMWHKY